MTDNTVALVRQAIFHVLDSASPRTPGLAWDFNDDEQRVDFADAVVAWLARPFQSESASDTQRLEWLLRKMDPVELDAVLGRSAAAGTSICTADEARTAIDEKITEGE